MTALTIPNSAETQMYAQKPPETSIPDRSQVVTANAAASTAQRINRNTSTRHDDTRKNTRDPRPPTKEPNRVGQPVHAQN